MSDVQLSDLSKLQPISSLSSRSVDEIRRLAATQKYDAGETLFFAGDEDRRAMYLLDGHVILVPAGGDEKGEVVAAGTPEATYPLADQQPRDRTAIAGSAVRALWLKAEDIDRIITAEHLTRATAPPAPAEPETKAADAAQDAAPGAADKPAKAATGDAPPKATDGAAKAEGDAPTSEDAAAKAVAGTSPATVTADAPGTEAVGFLRRIMGRLSGPMKTTVNAAEDNWAEVVAESVEFQSLPSDNVKQLIQRMTPQKLKAKEVVIQEGDEGDYYYVLIQGRARVTRKDGEGEVTLEDIKEGDCIGEEALISNRRRNATVTMLTDGRVMRLAKDDFNELVKTPLLQWLSPTEAQTRVRQGARWLDVRSEPEFRASQLQDAVSLPLHDLRRTMSRLDKDTFYVCYCDNGRLSSAAVFLLSQRGYHVAVMRGGLQRLQRV